MQNLTFNVYNVVQDEFFTRKIQKFQRSVFFVNTITIFSVSFTKIKVKFVKNRPFFNHQNFQAKKYHAIYKKLHFFGT